MVTTTETQDRIFLLESRLEETRFKLYDLGTMGALITSLADIETILSVVMEMSIRMVEGEVGLIQLFEDGELRSRITWGLDDAVVRGIVYKENMDIAAYCYTHEESIILNDYGRNGGPGPTIKDILAVPIKSRARCHGTIIIVNKVSGSGFSDDDRRYLEVVADFSAVAIDNSILLKASLEKQKLEQELGIARQVQEAILPQGEIDIEGTEIGTYYRPAREVGGDFYDVVKLNDHEFLFVIGDVSNKGVPAAMVMSATMAIIKTELNRFPEVNPAQLMENLNNILCDGVIRSQGMFVTLFLARLNMHEHRLEYCNAGHVPPLYWDTTGNEIKKLRQGGTLVGQFPGLTYDQGELTLNRGDRLFAFTDGLTEAEDIHRGFFGIERVMQVFLAEKELPAARFCTRVKEWVDRFREGAGEETIDDFTLFLMKIL